MAIASRVSDYLIDQGFDYHVVPHPYTESSAESARAAHISADSVAKGVVVATDDSGHRQYRLAVVSAAHDIDLKALDELLGEHLDLAEEYELPILFPDCAIGAVPVLGAAYDLVTVVDKSIDTSHEVYFEAGDHEELIRISGAQFRSLMADAQFGNFSYDLR
jgi:Ala-tRNA(Pro) deacylase